MKKTSIILFVLFFGVAIKGFSQTDKPADYYVGKWEIAIIGTPNGDAKFGTNLVRKDGKLTGELSNLTDPTQEKVAITGIDESADGIIIYFSTSGYDVNIDLKKVDDDNMKGMLMNMFESTAKKIK